jgi:hypothetical protein
MMCKDVKDGRKNPGMRVDNTVEQRTIDVI